MILFQWTSDEHQLVWLYRHLLHSNLNVTNAPLRPSHGSPYTMQWPVSMLDQDVPLSLLHPRTNEDTDTNMEPAPDIVGQRGKHYVVEIDNKLTWTEQNKTQFIRRRKKVITQLAQFPNVKVNFDIRLEISIINIMLSIIDNGFILIIRIFAH